MLSMNFTSSSHNINWLTIADDLEPLNDELDYDAQVRHSSSIHIRVFRTAMHGANV